MNASEAQVWDRVMQGWRQSPRQATWRRHCDAVHVALLERWVHPGPVEAALKTDLFDEAVGEGLAGLLGRLSRRVVGIDLSPAVRQAAQRRHPAMETLVADVRALPFPAGSFDLIVSNSTLDHFESPEEILRGLRELARVLRPGGNLVVTLDNPRNPVVRLRNALPGRWLRRLGVVPYPVGATCGASALRGMIRQAGLQTLHLTAIQHGPRAVAVAAGALLDRWGRPGGRERFLRLLMAFESLECWPTRFWSGYFVAAAAVKPPPGPGEGRAP